MWRSKKKDGKSSPKQVKVTTVLFVEFSRGGSLQKTLREVVDRLKPMLGFSIRIAEKGGTALGSLLSNKNLWSGNPCGRGSCKPCAQVEEWKQPCTLKNILYESECTKCNPQGSRAKSDKKGELEDQRDPPSIYVGESSRSLAERAGEHWEAAKGGNSENHMIEHEVRAHSGLGGKGSIVSVLGG